MTFSTIHVAQINWSAKTIVRDFKKPSGKSSREFPVLNPSCSWLCRIAVLFTNRLNLKPSFMMALKLNKKIIGH